MKLFELVGRIWWAGKDIFLERKVDDPHVINCYKESELIPMIKDEVPEDTEVRILIERKRDSEIDIMKMIKEISINCTDFHSKRNFVVFQYTMDFHACEYFGNKLESPNSDKQILFFTTYHKDGSITAKYRVYETDKGYEDYPWNLTYTEEAYFRGIMQCSWKSRYHCTLEEWLEERD